MARVARPRLEHFGLRRLLERQKRELRRLVHMAGGFENRHGGRKLLARQRVHWTLRDYAGFGGTLRRSRVSNSDRGGQDRSEPECVESHCCAPFRGNRK